LILTDFPPQQETGPDHQYTHLLAIPVHCTPPGIHDSDRDDDGVWWPWEMFLNATVSCHAKTRHGRCRG